MVMQGAVPWRRWGGGRGQNQILDGTRLWGGRVGISVQEVESSSSEGGGRVGRWAGRERRGRG